MNSKPARLEAPIPIIIREGDSEKLKVNTEVVNFLLSLPGPLAIISIAGTYRSGKSYLLNRIAGLIGAAGFDVGGTIHGCTRGIWLWPIVQKEQNMHIILLDTEGLGDAVVQGGASNSDEYDMAIFSLAILMSSLFIYNTVGVIDGDAIKKLSLVTKIADKIRVSAEDTSGTNLPEHFPFFMWLVRDFTLLLEDKNQRPITTKEYLESALTNVDDKRKAARSQNKVRDAIKHYFPKRECRVLRAPTDQDHLNKVQEIEVSQLDPIFNKQFDELLEFIRTNLQPKRGPNGIPLTGPLFVGMLQAYIDSIAQGAIPDMETAWESAMRLTNETAKQLAIEFYRNETIDLCNSLTKGEVYAPEDIERVHTELLDKASALFTKNALGELSDQYLQELNVELSRQYQIICSKNQENSERYCDTIFKQVHEAINNKLTSGGYNPPQGSYEQYEQDCKAAAEQYYEKARGPAIELIMSRQVDAMKATSELLLKSNTALNEAQKKEAAAREAARLEELKARNALAEQRKVQAEMLENQKKHELAIRNMEEQKRKEIEALAGRFQKQMAQMSEQQKAALEAGKKEVAEAMQKQMEIMKQQAEKEKEILERTVQTMNEERKRMGETLDSMQNNMQQMQAQLREKPKGSSFLDIVTGITSVLQVVPGVVGAFASLGSTIKKEK